MSPPTEGAPSVGRLRRFGFRFSTVAVSVLATYLILELLIAPVLHRRYGMFRAAYFVNDIDHRMPRNHPGLPTNGDGIRSRRESSEFRASHFNVILLGDSFVFGQRLAFEQTIPYKVEQLLGERDPAVEVRIANFGWVTSSPLLDYRLLRDIGTRYRPDVIALCLDMADFHDELVYERMFAGIEVHRSLGRFPIFVTSMRRFAPALYKSLLDRWSGIELPHHPFFITQAPLEETRGYTGTLMRSVALIRNYADQQGAEFVLFVFPRHFQYDRREAPNSWERAEYDLEGPHNLEPFRFFDEQRDRVEYPIHSLLDAFRANAVFPTCFDDDPHWNDAGATVAAEAIADALAGFLPSAAPVRIRKNPTPQRR